MSKVQRTPIERSIRQAQRRLVAQSLLNHLGWAWGVSLLLTVVWFALEPFAFPASPPWLRWTILGSTLGAGTIVAGWLTRRAAPSRMQAALALDQRFQLMERVTTVLALSPTETTTAAGQAVLADANAKVENVVVRGQFPVKLGKRALVLPLQVAAVVLLALFPPPTLLPGFASANKDDEEATKLDDADIPTRTITARPFIKPPEQRPNKSEELKQLEAELEKLYAEHNREENPEKVRPEQIRERVEKITNAEEKLKKREQEMNEKFQKLQEQLSKLTELDQGEARHDGPGKEFEEALAKGNLNKAQEEVDRLQKKAKDKKLDEQEAQQLKKQVEDLEKKIDQLTREQQQKKDKLKDLIDKAKKEGRDAESLEREMKQLEQEMKAPKEMQELAKALKESRKALEMNDFDGLAEQLGNVSKALGDLQDDLQDLEDLEEHLQNLKQMKQGACKQCEGEGNKKGEPGHKDNGRGYAEGASGKRDLEKDPTAKAGEEQRIRGNFDIKGRKSYGGTTNGPAFKKQTSGEMAGEIQQAIQDAPEAVEVQRLPKAAKEMVKEYFEKLGGQAPKK